MQTRVYTVGGAKGGVGKTTSSINIGASLAGEGYSTVVVELDLAMANLVDFLDIDIDVTEATTLHDVLAGAASVEAATYRTESGLWVLPSGTNLRGYADTDLKRLPNVVETLRDEFDVVLLDTPAGLSEETVRPMQLSDEVILVSTPRVASVRNARNTQDLAERVGVDVRGLVLTKSGTGASPGAERIASFLDTELLGHVPEDEAVPHSQDSGYPVVTNAPNSGAAIAYRRITEKLVDSSGQRTDQSGASERERSSDAGDERFSEQIAALSDSRAPRPPETESQSSSDGEQSENSPTEETTATTSQTADPDTGESDVTDSQVADPGTGDSEADSLPSDPSTDGSAATEQPSDGRDTEESETTEQPSDGPDSDGSDGTDPASDDESDERTTVPKIDPALVAESSSAEPESRADTQQEAPRRVDGGQGDLQPDSEMTESDGEPTTTDTEDTTTTEPGEAPSQATEASRDAAAESEATTANGGIDAATPSTDESERTRTEDGSDTDASGASTEETEESQADETSPESGGSSPSLLGRVLSLFS